MFPWAYYKAVWTIGVCGERVSTLVTYQSEGAKDNVNLYHEIERRETATVNVTMSTWNASGNYKFFVLTVW